MSRKTLKWMGCPTVSLCIRCTGHLSCQGVSGRGLNDDYSRYIEKGKGEKTDSVTSKFH